MIMTPTKEHKSASHIPSYVEQGMKQLTLHGYEAYLVGGAVRDILLGDTPADYDLASDATPEQMLEVFKEQHTILTGIKHGTITVVLDGHPLEITTYRIDGDYSDQRRPDRVTFSRSLEEDVRRRDFTINALAMDVSGRVLDYVDGQRDLSGHIIRCVGDPDLRMKEDALRILRAMRFSSVLGFEVDPQTRLSLSRNKDLLKKVASERVLSELSGLLCGAGVEKVLLQYFDILAVVLPEILPMQGFEQHNPHHIYDVWTHTARVVGNTPPDAALRWTALFHDSGKPSSFTQDEKGVGHFYGHQEISRELAHAALLRLKLDTRTRERVETLVLYHDLEIEPVAKIARRRLCRFGEPVFRDLLAIKRADTLAQSEMSLYRLDEINQLESLLESVLADRDCFSLGDLAINGEDLLAAGIPPGPVIGAILRATLRQVIDGNAPNNKEDLLILATFLHKNELSLFTNHAENGQNCDFL
jgi:tRNA nucleotidyltransferase (CCA-adding enzyme)